MDKSFQDMLDKIKERAQHPLPLSVSEALGKIQSSYRVLRDTFQLRDKPLDYDLYVEIYTGKKHGVSILVKEVGKLHPDPVKAKAVVQLLEAGANSFDVLTIALKLNASADEQPITTHYRTTEQVSEEFRLRALSYGITLKEMKELPIDVIQFLLEDLLPNQENQDGHPPSAG